MKATLEERLDEILASDLSQDEKLVAVSKTIMQHAPKRFSGWSNLLRRIADHIDTLPEPVMMSAKQIGALIQEMFLEKV